jgi:hypothetical protein
MIDYQSLVIAECLNHRTVIPPLPTGRASSERGERHFLCCSFVGEGELFGTHSYIGSGEGELDRKRQSALVRVQVLTTSVFISVHPWLNSLLGIPTLANPNPKSTAGSPKSTVDLGLEPLIWVKNGLQTPRFRDCWNSSNPITTRKLKHANQKQTDTGQKMNASALDLGYGTFFHPPPKGWPTPRWTGALLYFSIIPHG